MKFIKSLKTWALLVVALYAVPSLMFQAWQIIMHGLNNAQFIAFTVAFVIYMLASWAVYRSEGKE